MIVGCATLSVSANASTYNFTTFNGPGNNGGGTTVNGINNNGQVVGFSSDNAQNPTLFTNFIRNSDGTFTILNIANDPLAMANGINNSDTVVGGGSTGSAFTFSAGATSVLAPALPGNTQTQTAFGINNNGLIVGQFTNNGNGTTPGYLLSSGLYTILNPVANSFVTNAQNVNNNGLVTGFYSTDGAHQHPFFFNSVTDKYTLVADPVTPNLFLTQFLGINDNGTAVGYYQTNDGSQHGLLFNDITNTYTFLDDPNAASLNGVSITQITGINDSGEITGFYIDANGVQRGFVAASATSVPEPGTFELIVSALLMMMFTKLRRIPKNEVKKL